jgi:uncharacterized protein (TIGR02266 family)
MKPPRKLVARDERVTINHEFASVDQFIAEYVTNISRSGVFIKTKAPLEIGTKVNLKFTVIIDEIETIEGIGEVVRLQRDPPGMGVVFVELTSHSQDLIAKLITKRRVGQRPPRVTSERKAVPEPLAPPLPGHTSSKKK